jgi:hypothetical protein
VTARTRIGLFVLAVVIAAGAGALLGSAVPSIHGDDPSPHARAGDLPRPDGSVPVEVHAPSHGLYSVFIEFSHAGGIRTLPHTLEIGP